MHKANQKKDYWLDDELFDFSITHKETVDDLLRYCFARKVSDICVKTDSYVFVKKDGKMMQVTKQVLDRTKVDFFATVVSQTESITSLLKGSSDFDTSYEVTMGRRKFIRFRVNITSTSGRTFDTCIVMRTIPDKPPKIETMGIEEDLFESFFPPTGLVIVTGQTGSGKSTLLASALRYMIENRPCKIGTYEAPIEFILSRLDRSNASFVTQCEVGRGSNIIDFPHAAANALRNAHDVVLVGEARDGETIRGLAELAEQGTMTYSTMHTNSAYDLFSRIISTVGVDNRILLMSFISSLQCIIHQRLVPRLMTEEAIEKGLPGRVALREYMSLDENTRNELVMADQDKIGLVAKEINRRVGRMLDHSAEIAFERKEISEKTLNTMKRMRA